MPKTITLSLALIAAVAAFVQSSLAQDIQRATSSAPAQQLAAPEQPVTAADATTAQFGESIELALAQTKSGATSAFRDPTGQYNVVVHFSGAVHLVNVKTAQTQSWTIAPDASPAAINETVAQIMKAYGQTASEEQAGVGPLSDLGK